MNLEIVSSEMLEQGVRKLDWIFPRLRVLNMLCEKFERERPLKGLTIGMCLHVEPKTAGLLRVLLAEGEMSNLAGGKGNPAENMDMGLALQALAIKRIVQDHVELGKGAQPVPHEINQRVATLKLNSIFDY